MSEREMIPGDRGRAQSLAVRPLSARIQRWLAAGIVATLGAGVLAWYFFHIGDLTEVHKRASTGIGVAAASEMRLPALALPAIAPDPPVAAKPATSAEEAAGMRADAEAAQGGAAPHAASRRPAATADSSESARGRASSGSPVLVRSPGRTSAQSLASLTDAVRELHAGSDDDATPRARERGLREALQPTVTPATEAALLATRRWLLPKGSSLDCTLETAIDSTLPGLATCLLATDVYGADGRVVLLERGTRLVGETRADVRPGQARVAVLWNEARSPAGVVLALASPGTDALGRTGLPGTVDRHFAERFGAAVLLSVLDSAAQGFVNRRSGGGGVVYNSQGVNDVATEALRSTVGVPPTIRVDPGARVMVVVARDIDFRPVYRLAVHADE
ncbi:MAG: TrbI/VirB10 family protein [Proteobacteria bacterium]|nr:TrbI/VirB10 family protein [Pseudomonadota bacterium]